MLDFAETTYHKNNARKIKPSSNKTDEYIDLRKKQQEYKVSTSINDSILGHHSTGLLSCPTEQMVIVEDCLNELNQQKLCTTTLTDLH